MAIKNNPAVQLARAKINLDLLVTGRRADGYHLLDSLVVFANYGDRLSMEPAEELTLDITGATLTAGEDNLVLRAARLMQEYSGQAQGAHFMLEKNLPVASGIGGGSADCAAALKLCANMWDVDISGGALEELALTLGADVPVCLRSRACHMQGIGGDLTDINIAFPINLLLVNPGVSVSTGDIFRGMTDKNFSPSRSEKLPRLIESLDQLKGLIARSGNDLEKRACARHPEIANLLEILKKTGGVQLARMSGSGATCFGLYATEHAANDAVEIIRQAFPDAWIQPVKTM